MEIRLIGEHAIATCLARVRVICSILEYTN
jgi:hypothetical protein